MRIVARVIYGVLGGLAISLSFLVLFKPALALPPEAYSTLTAHLVREQAAEGMFIGLMSFWCLVNFDRRRAVHFALILFTAVFAGIHWAEYFHARRPLLSPLLNSVPFLALVATTPFKFLAKETFHSGMPAKPERGGSSSP
jgi:hypothetical protein